MFEHQPLSIIVKISFCIFPFVLSACFYIFIGFSITTRLNPQEVRNAIAITDCFFIYIIDCVMLFIYNKCMGSLSELFYGVDNLVLSILLILSYPVFFLFYLPFLMYMFLKYYLATPYDLWERVFGGGSGSLETLKCDRDTGAGVFGRYIYIGIPFFIFAVIYLAIFIALSPLWYFLFTPFGMMMYSICLAVSFNPFEVVVTTINDRVDTTYKWGLFINLFGIDLLAILSSGCYVGLVGPHFWAILLLVVSLLYFACFSVYSIYRLFCSDEPLFEHP
ncbi:hypothetical protein M9Y10_011415 [Tritrichomonas musculus]|uniref:PQ loop repeat family protein n=1 Tax=Tritrichomonas musculus TaxID=1915356 RepID=A0ABR2IJA8_9EUKA